MMKEEEIKIWKEAYQNILTVCEKYSDLYETNNFKDIKSMRNMAKKHLILIEWYKKYGIYLDPSYYNPHRDDLLNLNIHIAFIYFKDAKINKKNNRGFYISWSDDGRQPENGWYFFLRFLSGAYIFGNDYDEQLNLFNEFFNELKSYNPDYSDTHNHELYWKIENAKDIYFKFNSILKKYKERNKAELKQREKNRLKNQLEILEKGE